MYKLIFTFCSFLFFIISSNAQKDYNYGLVAGANLAKVTGDWLVLFQHEDIKPKYVSGMRIGFYLEMNVSEKFAVEPQLLYSRKGVKFEEYESGSQTVNNITQTYDIHSKLVETLNYLSIPVLFKYKINNFSVHTGLYFSKLLKAKLDAEATINVTETNHLTNTMTSFADKEVQYYSGTDGFNLTDIGYLFGVDYFFPFGLGLEAKIENGLSDTFDNSIIKNKFTNAVIQTGLKLKF